MSEQANNTTETSPQISIHRIYVRDLSFEAPKAPGVFRQDWAPTVTLDIKTHQAELEADVHEVVLGISVTVKNQEDVAFIAEVQQAGIFTLKGFDEEAKGGMLGAFCPNILFPYAREALDNMVLKGSFPVLMLAPINFDALYAQEQARKAEKKAAN